MDYIASPTVISAAEAKLVGAAQAKAAALEALRAAAVSSFRSFWHSGDTEQQAAIMGTKAEEAFTEHYLTVQYLASMGVVIPDADKVPPRPYQLNPDGSLTLLPQTP